MLLLRTISSQIQPTKQRKIKIKYYELTLKGKNGFLENSSRLIQSQFLVEYSGFFVDCFFGNYKSFVENIFFFPPNHKRKSYSFLSVLLWFVGNLESFATPQYYLQDLIYK